MGPSRSRAVGWSIALVVTFAVASGVALLVRSRGVEARVAAARRADLLVPVQCDGVLEPAPGGEVRATEPGTVVELGARDGQKVGAGQLLLRLANPELESQARAARAELLRVETEETSASAELEKVRSDTQHWEEVVAADRRLVEQAAIARSVLQGDELALSEARTRERSTVAQLEALQGPASRLQLARSMAADLERRVASLRLCTRRDGVVYGLSEKTGETVQLGQLVAGVIDPDHPRVRLRVDQPDLPRIDVGQRLVVSFSGLPDQQWEGRIVSAAQVLRQVGGRDVGEVEGDLADPHHALPLNASVEAEVVVAERPGALTVPRAALYRDGSRRFVYGLRRGRAFRRDVSVGLIGLSEVEITEGLAEGDPVLLAATVPLSEGLRVSPAP